MELSKTCLGLIILVFSVIFGIADSSFGNLCLCFTLFCVGSCVLILGFAERINQN